MKTKAGYVAIIGRPNVGKSTLMNSILGVKLSIVTDKPQTTRKRVLGIYSDDRVQAVFLDTPGIIEPKYELHRAMMGYVKESVSDADLVCLMISVGERKKDIESFEPEFLDAIRNSPKPHILLINKIDLLKNIKDVLPMIEKYHSEGVFKEIIPISALRDVNVKELTPVIEKYLPESEFFYDPEDLSSLPERFFVSEMIRERVFTEYGQEIPYSTEVNIVEFKERPNGKWYINAEIIIERTSQKPIIIGAKGRKIKSVGVKARKEIEERLGKPVYLDIFVKVRPKWRNNPNMLKSFGY